MDVRPVYWMLCGAGATLLSSAWASKQSADQTQNGTMVPAQTELSRNVADNSLLMKRQPWAEPKINPFIRVTPTEKTADAPIPDKLAVPQPPSFPYVFIGRLQAEEKNAVFLSKNNQVYSVEVGDVLEGIYRIERIESRNLEVTYLPDRKKLTLLFDSLDAKTTPPATTLLSQTEMPAVPAARQTLPQGMVGEVPTVENGQMTEDLKKMLNPPPPPQGDALKMMGVTPPPQGDALQIMAAPPVHGDAGMPGVSPTSVVPGAAQIPGTPQGQ